MHLDVEILRDFYYRTTLGRGAQSVLRRQAMQFWPEAERQTVLGYGFAVPLLRPYLKASRRVIALMPGPQGVMPWPHDKPNLSVLSEETAWPIETGLVDKLILMHGLETTDNPGDLLDEAYRVLGPGGQVMFVVPNRSGLWASADHTPFGYGRPYSYSQLEAQLKRHDFEPEQHVSVLYQPPSTRRFWMKTAKFWEKTGRAIPAVMAGGVFMVVARKRYPPRKRPINEAVKVLNPLEVLAPKPAKAAGRIIAPKTASGLQHPADNTG